MTARSPAAWREVGGLLRRQCRSIAAALVLVALSRAAAMGLPSASKYVVDEVIGRQRADRLGLVALLASAAVSMEAIAGFAAAQIAGVAGQRAVASLRQELQVRVLALPLRRLEESPAGVLATRVMADSEQIRYLVGNGLVQLIASILTATLALRLPLRHQRFADPVRPHAAGARGPLCRPHLRPDLGRFRGSHSPPGRADGKARAVTERDPGR